MELSFITENQFFGLAFGTLHPHENSTPDSPGEHRKKSPKRHLQQGTLTQTAKHQPTWRVRDESDPYLRVAWRA